MDDRELAAAGPSRPLTVLHVLAPAEFGGLESVVHALAVASRGPSVAARVAAVVPALSHPFVASLKDAGAEVVPIVVPGRAYRAERAAVARACREFEPDIVHTHGYHCDVVDAGVARRFGIPVVTTVHGFTGGDWKNRFYEWLQVRAYRRFDAVVAVSNRLGDLLARRGVPRDRIRVIHNGWQPAGSSLDREGALEVLGERPEAETLRIGWVGRLSMEKGPDVFVESLGRLRDRAWTACIVGDGPARIDLERRAAALGIGDRIHWHGVVERAGTLFPAFDVFVISSRTEGMPIVLFEAMASEVPVVTTAVGGIPEAVSASEARLVVSEDPAALAAGIADVLDHADTASARARNAARRLRDEFGVDRWLSRYEAVYRGLVEGGKS